MVLLMAFPSRQVDHAVLPVQALDAGRQEWTELPVPLGTVDVLHVDLMPDKDDMRGEVVRQQHLPSCHHPRRPRVEGLLEDLQGVAPQRGAQVMRRKPPVQENAIVTPQQLANHTG